MRTTPVAVGVFISLAIGIGAYASQSGTDAPNTAQIEASGDTEELPCRREPSGALPPLDLSDMRLWDYSAKWHASEWENRNGLLPWRADHIHQRANGDVVLRLDSAGAPQLKGEDGLEAATSGIWEVEATIPMLRHGMIVAPLWIFNQEAGDEVDFEFAGRRSLDMSVHSYRGGTHRTITEPSFLDRDWSNCTMKFKIMADFEAGWAEMYVEDRLQHRFERDDLSFFPTQPALPVIEIWVVRPDHDGFRDWAGRWQGLAEGEAVEMVVHGYSYRPLSPQVEDR